MRHSTHVGVRGSNGCAADASWGFRLGRFRRESNVEDCRLFLKACDVVVDAAAAVDDDYCSGYYFGDYAIVVVDDGVVSPQYHIVRCYLGSAMDER